MLLTPSFKESADLSNVIVLSKGVIVSSMDVTQFIKDQLYPSNGYLAVGFDLTRLLRAIDQRMLLDEDKSTCIIVQSHFKFGSDPRGVDKEPELYEFEEFKNALALEQQTTKEMMQETTPTTPLFSVRIRDFLL